MNAVITMREEFNKYGEAVESLEISYIVFFERFMRNIVPVLSSSFLPEIIDMADAVILTGGGSVPSKFREYPTSGYQQHYRDLAEEKLLKSALEKQVPIIGICRGLQFINGFFGGKVVSLSSHHAEKRRHPVLLENGETICVNSYHNDGVTSKTLASCFTILAKDPEEDIIEAMYSPALKIIAFQWHPEREREESACKKYSASWINSILNEGR